MYKLRRKQWLNRALRNGRSYTKFRVSQVGLWCGNTKTMEDRELCQEIWSYSLVYQDETIVTHYLSYRQFGVSHFIQSHIPSRRNAEAIKNLLHALGPTVVDWKKHDSRRVGEPEIWLNL